jgi:tRNA A37 threonylcarbamoyladenosine dehydratase
MDPISITTAVLSITARCLTTARALYALRERYKHAQMTISAIYSESTVISASLGHVQNLLLSKAESLASKLKSREELENILDTSLTGCTLVYSILHDEVQKLSNKGETAAAKASAVWKEETMKELLQQIRGQQTALTLLIQALQM